MPTWSNTTPRLPLRARGALVLGHGRVNRLADHDLIPAGRVSDQPVPGVRVADVDRQAVVDKNIARTRSTQDRRPRADPHVADGARRAFRPERATTPPARTRSDRAQLPPQDPTPPPSR